MAPGSVRAALLAAVLAATPSVVPGTRFVAYQAGAADSFEFEATTRPRLTRVHIVDAPEASRWTTTGTLDTANARLVVEVGYPADWRTTEDGLDDVSCADVVVLIAALRAATWPAGLLNMTIGPAPVLSSIVGAEGAIVGLVLSITIGVEYATGS